METHMHKIEVTHMNIKDAQLRQPDATHSIANESEFAHSYDNVLHPQATTTPHDQELTETAYHYAQKHRIGSHENPVSIGIQGLPSELLQNIFLLCLPEVGHPTPTQAPLLLCHICSAWRSVAFGLPQLWNVLSLAYSDDLSDSLCEKAAEIMGLWFGKAADRLLSFTLRYTAAYDGLSFERTETCRGRLIGEVLALYSRRLRHLDLHIPMRADLSNFITLPPGQLDFLESLNFHVDASYWGEVHITVFESAPCLRKVDISINDSELFDENSLCRFDLPWAHLTHIKLNTFILFNAFKRIFSQCMLLQSCDFYVDCSEASSPIIEADQSAIYTDLCSIKINTASSDMRHPCFLFDGINFPRLTEFSLNDFWVNSSWIQALHRTLPTLRRLSILSGYFDSVDSLVTLLHGIPSLAELYISTDDMQCPGYDTLWNFLSYREDHSVPLLPELEVLDVVMGGSCGPDGPTFNRSEFSRDLVQMVKSRWGTDVDKPTSNVRLKRIRLYFGGGEVVGRLVSLLEPLQLEGLEVNIS